MEQILFFVLVGLIAQFLGGALGMGYGITCTSMLLLAGLSPVAASSSVHVTEVVTGLVAGFSHWRLNNVDWRLTSRLAIPGCIGALAGGHLLGKLSTASAKPVMAAMLIGLGVFVLVRFVRGKVKALHDGTSVPSAKFLSPLGLGAGFIDATGGGGWGALTTSTLLGTGRIAPRTAVGSADASKCIVSVAAVIGLVSGAGTHGIHPSVVLPLIAGGIVSAPIAAYVVTKLHARVLGILAGIVIIAVNLPVAVAVAPASAKWWVGGGTAVVAAALVLYAARHPVSTSKRVGAGPLAS